MLSFYCSSVGIEDRLFPDSSKYVFHVTISRFRLWSQYYINDTRQNFDYRSEL